MINKRISQLLIFSGLTLMAGFTFAQDSNPTNEAIENIIIIGDPQNIAGSAHVLDKEELSIFKASDMLRMLRSVPGVYIQEEDGFGLRPNIGIRGSGIDRSGKIAVMEDGVLIAPAPYTASSAYYFPTARRMSAVEVLKGPSSIAVGPRTTGGALNMVSTQIPDEMGLSGELDFRAGNHDSTDTHAYVANRGERFSWLVETVQQHTDGFKQLDGPAGIDAGDTGFDIQDYMVKMQYDLDPSSDIYQSVRVKLGATQQISNETYLGLTDDDYKVTPYRRYAASQRDQFKGHHEQMQLTYVIDSNKNWRGEVTIYDNDFHRDWFKLQKIGGASQGAITGDPVTNAVAYGYLTGATNSPDDAVVLRHNNRFYNSQGVQGKASYDFDLSGDANATINVGFRVHSDYEDRKQREDKFRMENMELVNTTLAAPSSKTNRFSKSDVNSYFMNAEIEMGDFTLTPGVRFEDIDNVRYDYSTKDPSRAEGPTKTKKRSEDATVAGMGVVYKMSDDLRLIAGIHQGYQPPGAGSKAKAEESVNIEFGAKAMISNSMFEAIAFFVDYDNMVGTVTASTGGTGNIGDQYDGGAVEVQGIELSGARSFISGNGIEIPVSFQYTWTSKAEFGTSFESGFDGWGDVVKGDRLPYMPSSQLRASVGAIGERLSANLSASYASESRALSGQGGIPGNQLIEARWVIDAISNYKVNDEVNAYVKIDNLFDTTYVAARRPAGIRPGMERQVSVGINIQF